MIGDDGPDHDPPDHDPPDHDPELDYEEEEPGSTFIRWPRDPKLDPAKSDLLNWFEGNRTGVFYGRQIEVIFEKKYFHWITHKALRELTRGRGDRNGNARHSGWKQATAVLVKAKPLP
jgi:hypothetical protein